MQAEFSGPRTGYTCRQAQALSRLASCPKPSPIHSQCAPSTRCRTALSATLRKPRYRRGVRSLEVPAGSYLVVKARKRKGVYHYPDCYNVTGDWDGAEQAVLGDLSCL